MALPQTFPLFYKFQDTVIGSGFIAEVYIKGRATVILDQEEDGPIEYSFNGVEPGGLAQVGGTLNESYYAFKHSLKQILVELSYRSNNFDHFQEQVTKFVRQVNVPEELDWNEAREAVRRGELEPPVPKMKRDTKNHGQAALNVRLVQEETATPDLNPQVRDSLVTAA